VIARECANRFAVITVDDTTGDRIVLWDRDDRLNLSAQDIDIRLVASARIVHVDDEDQHGAIAAATAASEAGVIVTSDIERVNGLTMQLISAVSIPIFAQHVLPQMTGQSDPERGLRAIRGANPDKPLIATLGPAGAMMLDRDEVIHVPGFEVQAFDTTGAGDVFRAGLIYALLNDFEPREMLAFANAAAALSCTRGGAMTGVPTLEDVKFFLSGV